MKVGIYLAYRPWVNMSFTGEGLGRYMAKLVTMLDEHKCKVVIACPLWVIDAMEELFTEYNFPLDKIEFVTPRSESIMWRIIKARLLKKPKEKKNFKDKIVNASYDFTEVIIDHLVKLKSNVLFAAFVLLAVICGIILLPAAVVVGVMYLILKLICKIFKTDLASLSPIKFAKKILTLNGKVNLFFQFLSNKGVPLETLEKIRMDAAREIIRRIDKMKEPADVWYTPMAFWPDFTDINGVTVTCFPDLITNFFAPCFAGTGMGESTDNVRDCVNHGKYFIVYSEYQRQQVLSANLGISRDHIRAINISSFINLTFPDIELKGSWETNFDDPTHIFARNLLQRLPDYALPDVKSFLQTPFNPFSFRDTEYIFYSAQARPNKNIVNLIKAYEYLLRTKGVKFKLFLTCNPDHNPVIKDYIYSRRLQYDVLCFYHVPNQLLAAMYACAVLVVNPTIYEGGFPFTFSESLSVGTPSIMGTIPQVTDIAESYGIDDCLFDPFDYMDIADKIVYGVNNREELKAKLMPLYNKICNDMKNAGREYIDAFEYFAQLYKKEGKKQKRKEKPKDDYEDEI